MKVENVERIQNNPDNFNNTGMEREAMGKGQFGAENLYSENLSDIIDINVDPETPTENESGYAKNLQHSDEKLLYNDKGTKLTTKSTNKFDGRDKANVTEYSLKKDFQVDNLRRENAYSSSSSSASRPFSGRDYGSGDRLNSFTNPEFSAEKNIFYNEKNGEVKFGQTTKPQTQAQYSFEQGKAATEKMFGNIKGVQNLENRADKNFVSENNDKGFELSDKRFAAERDLKFANNKISSGEYEIKEQNFANKNSNVNFNHKYIGSDFDIKPSGNVLKADNPDFENLNKAAESELSPTRVNSEFGKNNVSDGNYSTEKYYKKAGGKSNLIFTEKNGESIAEQGQTKTSAKAEVRLRKYAENYDASESNGYVSGDGENIDFYEKSIINLRKSAVDANPEEEKVQARRGERPETSQSRSYASAQLAYQNIISKTAAEIYGKAPGLERLIEMLFKIRKLTLKRVGYVKEGSAERFERTENENEIESLLGEVKSFVNKGDFKSGKAIEVFERFSDDLEKIKYCVGLSPFAADIGNYPRYFDEVKTEVEDIRSALVRKRRNEILRAVFGVLLLAFGVGIIYLIFLR